MTAHYQPGLHRFAVLTAVVALLPITVGALVTTLGAGMAFLDWPSSDSHNMFLYPWFQSLRLNPDKFVEHGHRLAGIVIGLVSIALAVTFWLKESRTWARWLGLAVLVLVVGQGILGGQRVLLDARGLALLHGLLASWLFAFISCVALMTSRGWYNAADNKPEEWNLGTGISAVVAVVAIQLQYVLGGLLRHNGMALFEHLGMACLVLLAVMWVWVGAYCSGIRWLRGNANLLAIGVVLQIGLGVLTFVAKFGFGDYVAVQQSLFQIWTRTSHTVLGMFVWMLAVVYLLRVFRIMWVRYQPVSSIDRPHGGFNPTNVLNKTNLNLVSPSLQAGGTP
ncbi:MAG: ctaA [Planctomycetaceae bacterium]|nr:ctaA [Planctomycetaceae bacterium]